MQDSPPPPLRSRLVTIGIWLLILAPILGCGWLVKHYSYDQRFLDDWVWADDLVKWKEGDYQGLYHNLVSVHLEHRPIVARTLAFLVTLWSHGDVTAQNLLSFIWLLVAFSGLLWLWLKPGQLSLRGGWLALFLAAVAFFTPMQWQNLLWPICHETPMPIMFLVMALCLSFLPWRWWVRSLWGAIIAILGMLSFASGFLLWGLPLPVLLFNGRFTGIRQRVNFVVIWGAIFAVTMLLYLQVKIQTEAQLPHDAEKAAQVKVLAHLPAGLVLTYDLHNEVPGPYAYHHEKENTMNREFAAFLENPGLDAEFVATFSGAILVRGWSADIKLASERVGFTLIACLLLAGVYLLWYVKDETLRNRLLPAICFGAYTPLTALMVAVGRIYAGGTGSALNGRYTVHQTVLLVALIWAWQVIVRHRQELREKSGLAPLVNVPAFNVAVAGMVAGVLAVGWVHGQAMMYEWQAGRVRAAAAQYLSGVFSKNNHFVGSVAGNFTIAHDYAASLNKYGLLRNGLASSTDLFEAFKPADEPLIHKDKKEIKRLGEFERLYKAKDIVYAAKPFHFGLARFHYDVRIPSVQPDPDPTWQVQGYAYLPGSQRPADAIILAYKVPGGRWTMFGLTQAYGTPRYLARSMGKDLYSMIPSRDTWPDRLCCAWDPDVHFEAEPPPNATISAWAVDMERHRVYRVLRPVKALSDPPNGLPIQDFADDIAHDD